VIENLHLKQILTCQHHFKIHATPPASNNKVSLEKHDGRDEEKSFIACGKGEGVRRGP
jgi:hypothetical protein